jgi:hypothetical protein
MLLLLRYGEWAAGLSSQQVTTHVYEIAATKQYGWLSKTAGGAMMIPLQKLCAVLDLHR